ncbi:hypothetical protein LTR17_020850 [Elasticomyces elasticus]|nr:hypothetical protein LTR17_020850 [Elasticomyces elasticus]
MANTPEAERVQRSSIISTQREPKVYTLDIHIAVGSSLELVYRDDQDPDTVARDWLEYHGYSHVQEAHGGIVRAIRKAIGEVISDSALEPKVPSLGPAQVEPTSKVEWPKYDQFDTFAIQGQTPAACSAFVKAEETSNDQIAKLVKENPR